MMNLKKSTALLTVALTAVLTVPAPQALAFGLGNLTSAVTSAGSSSNVSAGDVDAFIKTAQEADLLVNSAANYIFKSVAQKEQIAKYEEAMKAAEIISDAKEKDAKINQIKADRDTELHKSLASKETQDKVKSMSKEQLKHFGNAGYTFMLGLLKDKQLAEGSTALVSAVAANPMLATKLIVLKDTAASVVSQVKSASQIGEGLIKLAKVGNLNIMPTSSSDKPKAVAEI